MSGFELHCPLPGGDGDRIQLAHGGGGHKAQRLLEQLFLPRLGGDPRQAHDAAVHPLGTERFAFTTDGYVVRPLEFPGGNIGELAVYGTVNDLLMAGAEPLALSAAFILEEGFEQARLERIVDAMAAAAAACGVAIATGDTKVVERGKADGCYLTTSGVGRVPAGREIHPRRVQPGDAILVTGDLGRHGIAVISARDGLEFETAIASDCASLQAVINPLFAADLEIHCLRDLTRGGLASALNEIAIAAGVGMTIREPEIPLDPGVASACELLGLDPWQVACEGRAVIILPMTDVPRALGILGRNGFTDARRIGQVTAPTSAPVILETAYGSRRILEMLSGEQLPRIC